MMFAIFTTVRMHNNSIVRANLSDVIQPTDLWIIYYYQNVYGNPIIAYHSIAFRSEFACLSTSSMFSSSSFLPVSSFLIFDAYSYLMFFSIKICFQHSRSWLLWLLLTEITEIKLNFLGLIFISCTFLEWRFKILT